MSRVLPWSRPDEDSLFLVIVTWWKTGSTPEPSCVCVWGGDRIHEGYTRDPVTSLALLVLLSPRLWSYDVNLGDSAYRRNMCCPEHGEASFPSADPSAACRTLATFLEEGGLCPFSVV